MTKEALKDYFAILPECLRSHAYIVGGAATDLELAADVDIVLLSSLSVKKIQERLNLCCSYPIDIIMDSRPIYSTGIRAEVCTVSSEFTALRKNIHLMVSDCPCIEPLLLDFDLSVHQSAYNTAGVLFQVDTSTFTDVPIEVVKFNSPDSTLKRYIRLSKRYNLPLNQNVINSLRYLGAGDGGVVREREGKKEIF